MSKPRSVESPMGILPVQIKKTVIIVFFSQELKVRKKMASLCNEFTVQWLQGTASGTASHCNGCVAFKQAVRKYFINKDVYFRFFSSFRLCLQTKLPLS